MFSRNLGPKKKKNGKSKNINSLSTTPKTIGFCLQEFRAWPWVILPPFSQPWLLGLEGFAPRHQQMMVRCGKRRGLSLRKNSQMIYIYRFNYINIYRCTYVEMFNSEKKNVDESILFNMHLSRHIECLQKTNLESENLKKEVQKKCDSSHDLFIP